MESFWDFSVRTYRTPGVPDACLSLQNDHGVDVNMLLFCAWTGESVGEFDGDLFDRANDFSSTWAENVVIPLREARTWMKHSGCDGDPMPTDDCMALREEIKKVEFAAEKLQQRVLESLVTVDNGSGPLIDNVVANLKLYLDCLDIQPTTDVRGKLAIIVCAAFPDIDAMLVTKALET